MKRAAMYVRVSTDEQARHGYSIETQAEVVRKYAEENHYNIVGEYIEAGASAHGSIKRRPELMRLIRDVEHDRIDTILFIKIDRWFRSVKDYYAVQTILDEHHVQWRAVMEDYETETSAGRFKVNIMLSIAQAESERTSERIKMVFEGKRAKGEVTSHSAPVGIKVENKKIVADPETQHIAKEAFQKYIELRNYPAVCRYINDKYNMMHAYLTMRNLLHNHRYVEVGIIDQATFDTVQEIFKTRAPRKRKERGTYMFSGMMRCAECGYAMRASNDRSGKGGWYGCGRRARYGEKGCSHRLYITDEKLETALLSTIEDKVEEYNIDIRQKRKSTPVVDKAAIKRKMSKLADLYMNDMIEKSEYETRYSELRKALESVPAVIPLIDTSALKDALSVYNSLDYDHKRAFWSRTVKEIRVDKENNIFFDLQSL